MNSAIPRCALALTLALSSPAAAQPPPEPRPVDEPNAVGVTYLSPSCPAHGSTNISLVVPLFEHFEHAAGSFYVESAGPGVLGDDQRIILPSHSMTDTLAASNFVAGGGPFERELLVEKLPVLDSPYEIVFQYPVEGHIDGLSLIQAHTSPGNRYPDTRLILGRLVRLRNAAGQTTLALEWDEPGEISTDVLAYRRHFSAVCRIRTEDDAVTLYSIGKPIGTGGRTVQVLADTRRPDDLLLQPGGLVPSLPDEDSMAFCGGMARELGVDALVPRDAELALTPEALTAFAREHELPYLAANLVDAASGERPFPRFRLFERRGLVVAVVGTVDTDQLEALSGAARDRWRVETPGIALGKALAALEAQAGRRPDLTVVLMATGGTHFMKIAPVTGADVVLGLFDRWDVLPIREHVSVVAPGRESVRGQPTLLAVRGSQIAVGRIEARFTSDTPARLTDLLHRADAVHFDGPRDPDVERAVRVLEEGHVKRGAQVVLPDVAPIVDRTPALHDLVWGEHMLHRGGFRNYRRPYPARFSDNLWMRLVTNVMREALDADVAISRNLPRRFDTVGPISHDVLREWLVASDAVAVVNVPGAALGQLAARVQQQTIEGRIAAAQHITVSGLDTGAQRVAGRPLDPQGTYRLAITDYVLRMPDLEPILGATTPEFRFVATDSTRWSPDTDGEPLQVRDVILARFAMWKGDDPAAFPPGHLPALEGLLRDQSADKHGQWSIRVDQLSISNARYTNTNNVAKFAASRETRTSTPDNVTIAARVNLAQLYDGPALAWENRVRGALQRIELDIPGQDVPAQEQADDVVASTELRLNAVHLEVSTDRVPVVPYVQLAYDTELTATPNPTPTDPDATFPHQQIGRVSLGFVTYPGPRLQETRLGFFAQRDFSESDLHDDFGVLAGYRLQWPLFAHVTLESELDLRYAVPDDDDRDTDLSLILASVNKLMVPVIGGLSVFGLADLYMVRGKLEVNDEIGGSYILGGGLDFRGIYRL